MGSTIYGAIINAQLERCSAILLTKEKEYATEDMLHTFKVAAALQDCSMPRALAGMMVKHTSSVYKMCQHPEDFSKEQWNEKITDHINYLLILQAMISDIHNDYMQEVQNESTPTTK